MESSYIHDLLAASIYLILTSFKIDHHVLFWIQNNARLSLILCLHWPSTDVKCWVPVNHVFQLLSILTVNTSGHLYTFLKSEFKDTQNQCTENLWRWWKHCFMHLPIEICPSTSNSLIIIGNFLLPFLCCLYSYSWLFQ